MAYDLRCRCGTVQGAVERLGGETRAVCYCRDCQAYAQRLGHADEILDREGGTQVLMTSPKAVTFQEGVDRLACMRMTGKGPLRWYAACCNTPIGNTMPTHKAAFVGLLAPAFADDALSTAFGPPTLRNFTAYARGEPKPRQTPLPKLVGRILAMTLKGRLDGSYRQTPFFDAATGRPVAEPTLASREPA